MAVFVNDAVAGYPLMMLAAEFAYDWHVNTSEKILSEYKKRIDKLSKEAARRVKQSVKQEQASQTHLAVDGVIRSIRRFLPQRGLRNGDDRASRRGKLRVSMGNMHCLATPYTEEDTIRVELIPRSGMVVQFVVENGLVTALDFAGDVFTRVD